MSRSGLADQFTRGTWYKFSKEYKEKYKKENGKDLENDVAYEITFGKIFKKVQRIKTIQNEDGTISKQIVEENEMKHPEIEDDILLIKLGNKNCDDESALIKIDRYYEKEENEEVGQLGMHLDLMCDFYKDLKIRAGAYKSACKLRDEYREKIKKSLNDIENINSETDTQGK